MLDVEEGSSIEDLILTEVVDSVADLDWLFELQRLQLSIFVYYISKNVNSDRHSNQIQVIWAGNLTFDAISGTVSKAESEGSI